MKKIEQQELEQLKSLQSKANDIILELGDVSYGEIMLRLKKEKTEIKLSQLQDEEKTLQEFLIQKYGENLNINLEDGSY
jgi:hypothetical protein